MTPDLFFWILARVSGLSCFAALAISVLTGVALRTAVFDWMASNRGLKATHEFMTVLWIPLGLLHLVALVLDQTARVAPWDLVLPFVAAYDDRGRLALGLGTLAFDIFVLVAITSWLRSRMNQDAWRWIHRLSYLAFGMVFLHAVLGGTDFSSPVVSALTFSAAFALAILALARLFFSRLPAR